MLVPWLVRRGPCSASKARAGAVNDVTPCARRLGSFVKQRCRSPDEHDLCYYSTTLPSFSNGQEHGIPSPKPIHIHTESVSRQEMFSNQYKQLHVGRCIVDVCL